MVSIHGRQ